MSQNEIEVKIRVEADSFDSIRERAIGLGFREHTPPTREENHLLDFPDGRLARTGSALRLRQYGEKSLLTFKGPAIENPQFKIREELEATVQDLPSILGILRRLGLESSFRYSKEREKLVLGSGSGEKLELCLDRTPIGSFVELEGPPERIRELAGKLGWSEMEFIKRNYVDLYMEQGLGE